MSKIFFPLQLPISNQQIQKFKRLAKTNNDCVVNTLEVLGILDATGAAVARILVGNNGVKLDQFSNIFKLFFPHDTFTFYTHKTSAFIEDFVFHQLKPGYAIVCVYKHSRTNTGNVDSHMFLLGKTLNKKVMYMDPMFGDKGIFCDVTIKQCAEIFAVKGLEYSIFCASLPYDTGFPIVKNVRLACSLIVTPEKKILITCQTKKKQKE